MENIVTINTLQFYLYELAKDDLIYLFLPLFLHSISPLADVKRAPKYSDKLNYLFKAPGWSHDGEDKRAKVLRVKLSAS